MPSTMAGRGTGRDIYCTKMEFANDFDLGMDAELPTLKNTFSYSEDQKSVFCTQNSSFCKNYHLLKFNH